MLFSPTRSLLAPEPPKIHGFLMFFEWFARDTEAHALPRAGNSLPETADVIRYGPK